MKNLTYSFLFFLGCLVSLSSCSKEDLDMEYAELSTEAAPVSYTIFELEVLELVNKYREEKGLSAVGFMDEISLQASIHNKHMIERSEVCHDDFGSRYSNLVNAVEAKAVRENVAFGYRTAEAVFEGWLKSEKHRETIEGDYTHTGISILKDENEKYYFTNIFVRR